MPELPNFHAGFAIAATVFAFFLFSREKIALETSSLVVLAGIVLTFQLLPFPVDGAHYEAVRFFSGFGHEALIAVIGLMVCGQALVVTGALQPVGRWIARLWRFSPTLSVLLTLLFGAVGSAFVNNTPIVVLLIPILANVASRMGESAAPWLMPMNFSTLLGGSCTTIGTSTNLLVISVAADLGLRRFDMFDFALPGAIGALIGIAYLWLIAPLLLSREVASREPDSKREFQFEGIFSESSSSLGKTVAELQKKADVSFDIVEIKRQRDSEARPGTVPLPDMVIAPGDRVLGRTTADEINELEQILDVDLAEQVPHYPRVGEAPDEDEEQQREQAQIVVMESSALIGLTLRQSAFESRFGVQPMALHRAAGFRRSTGSRFDNTPLAPGDILLVRGLPDNIDRIKSNRSLLVLDERQDVPDTSKGWLAAAILTSVVLLAALNILPIAVSATIGAVAMILTRCMSWRNVSDAISIPVIMIVVVSLALGSALTVTGATDYIAKLFLAAMADAPSLAILAALIGLMALMTNIVSNNAAAVIGTPIAISIANELGAAPETFVLAVLFGANLSFVTPMAYKTNVLVMSAGDYRFSDFVRVGLPLTLLLWVSFTFLLSEMYGL